MHAWCFTEVCPHSALLNIFLMTWMIEQRISLLNLHADDMLGGNFDRLDYRIRNQNVSVHLNMLAAILRCCKSEVKAVSIPSHVNGSDVCSACEVHLLFY